MKPLDQIRQLYRQWPQPRAFSEDVRAHIETGVVISTRDFFVMGREIERDSAPALIENPWHSFANPDTWLVYAYAGRLNLILDHIPHKMQFVAFTRKGSLIRYYDFETLLRRIRQQG